MLSLCIFLAKRVYNLVAREARVLRVVLASCKIGCLITGLPVAQSSYKMGLDFPSGTNHTLACLARAQDMRVCVE